MSSPLYRILSLGRQLGIGVAGSHYATLQSVAKCNGPEAPYCLPNEMICSEIGRFLRLPLPPAAVVEMPNLPQRFWFTSLDFNLTGNSLPPVDTGRCVTDLPELSAGLLLFDVLVGNCDRHRANFSVDFGARPTPRMNIFDHSHALFGPLATQGGTRLALLRDRLAVSGGPQTGGNRHCLLDAIPDDGLFVPWVNRIRSLPDFFIEDVVGEARPYGLTDAESATAVAFLRYRRDRLLDIVRTNRAEFTGIVRWRSL